MEKIKRQRNNKVWLQTIKTGHLSKYTIITIIEFILPKR